MELNLLKAPFMTCHPNAIPMDQMDLIISLPAKIPVEPWESQL